IRTHDTTVKGWCLDHLTTGPYSKYNTRFNNWQGLCCDENSRQNSAYARWLVVLDLLYFERVSHRKQATENTFIDIDHPLFIRYSFVSVSLARALLRLRRRTLSIRSFRCSWRCLWIRVCRVFRLPLIFRVP
ncbi:MAG: hypothetical protein LBQ05_03315, partial [Christensenellaceae bacterium]|nr:hypothetical protein [Christensenellaceae bacterium]